MYEMLPDGSAAYLEFTLVSTGIGPALKLEFELTAASGAGILGGANVLGEDHGGSGCEYFFDSVGGWVTNPAPGPATLMVTATDPGSLNSATTTVAVDLYAGSELDTAATTP